MNQVIEWYKTNESWISWVFSGAGISAIVLLVGLLCKNVRAQKADKAKIAELEIKIEELQSQVQKQSADGGSTSLQAGGNIHNVNMFSAVTQQEPKKQKSQTHIRLANDNEIIRYDSKKNITIRSLRTSAESRYTAYTIVYHLNLPKDSQCLVQCFIAKQECKIRRVKIIYQLALIIFISILLFGYWSSII